MLARLSFVALLLAIVPLRTDAQVAKGKPQPAKVVLETWQAAYFEGVRAGHASLLVHEIVRGKQKVYKSVRKVEFSIKRYGSVIPIKMEQTHEETADGKILALGLNQSLGKDRFIKLSGKVENGKLVLTLPDGSTRKLNWDDKALGQYAQERIFKTKKAKTGDKFAFQNYELLLGGLSTMRATVKSVEAVDALKTETKGKKVEIVRVPVKLLRADVIPDKVKVGDRDISLPTKGVWLDKNLMPVREQATIEGIGTLTLYNTTKDAALKEGIAPDKLPDIGLTTMVPVKQTIEKPYQTTGAVYRITVKDIDKPQTAFSRDGRQQVKNVKKNSFELHVKAIRTPAKVAKVEKPAAEFTESSYFIDSDKKEIKDLAKTIVGTETDAWEKAKKLERWTNVNMKYTTASGFPTASQICKSKTGDCRQHALLLAALCRAAGIPSRTAVGLVYVRPEGRSPMFGFHMWTEAWVKGQWMSLDGVAGEGGIGATHLKINDHSWAKTETLAPLLPVQRVLGKLSIEVISTK